MGIMGKNIAVTIQWIGSLFYFVELIIALRVSKNENAPDIMKKFFWYPLVGAMIGLLFVLKNLKIIPTHIGFITNTISLLFHYSFLSFFIYNVTGKQVKFKIVIFLFFLVLIGLIISDILNGYTTSFAFANGCLFVFSLYYFRTLLVGKATIILKKNPIFYTCCGIFIGSGIIVPSALMIKYLVELKLAKDSLFLINIFSGVGYLLINLFFIKALLQCIKPNK